MRQIAVFLVILLAACVYAADNLSVSVSIPDGYAKVGIGDSLWSTATIFNMGGEKRVDITVRYDILDAKNSLIATKTKTIAIETQVSTSQEMKMPESAQPGTYTLKVTVSSVLAPEKTYAGEHSFEVVKDAKKTEQTELPIIIYGAIILALIALPILALPKLQKYKEKQDLRNKVRGIVRSRIRQ